MRRRRARGSRETCPAVTSRRTRRISSRVAVGQQSGVVLGDGDLRVVHVGRSRRSSRVSSPPWLSHLPAVSGASRLLADLVETSTGQFHRRALACVIRLSILVQGGALRAPLAGPFLPLPGKVGMRAVARSRRPAESTASGDHPVGTTNGVEPSPGRQVSGMAARVRTMQRKVAASRVSSRRPPEGLSARSRGASVATYGPAIIEGCPPGAS